MSFEMKKPRSHKTTYLHSSITVKGIVQIVGFRENIKNIAIRNRIFGEIRNLSNGDVSVVCEGKKEDVCNFEQELYTLKDDTNIKKREVLTLDKKLKKVNEEIRELGRRQDEKTKNKLYFLRKSELKLKKRLRLLRLPEPEITNIPKPKHNYIQQITFPPFKIVRDIEEQGERLDLGAHQLLELRKENLDNIDFGLMDMNFDRLDFKYGAISKNMNKLMDTQNKFIIHIKELTKSMGEDRKEMKKLVDNINTLVKFAIEKIPSS